MIFSKWEWYAASSDFAILNLTTNIPPGLTKACLQLEAINDEIIEDNEQFTITFKAMNPRDSVNGTTSLIVDDNDGKHSRL